MRDFPVDSVLYQIERESVKVVPATFNLGYYCLRSPDQSPQVVCRVDEGSQLSTFIGMFTVPTDTAAPANNISEDILFSMVIVNLFGI